MTARLYRVILPVDDIEAAADFYGDLFATPGERVSAGRHYFDCGGTILACYDPHSEGDKDEMTPNPEHVYFAVDDLELFFDRARNLACQEVDAEIATRPWGERSFYATDPFGNPICFADAKTLFTGAQG